MPQPRCVPPPAIDPELIEGPAQTEAKLWADPKTGKISIQLPINYPAEHAALIVRLLASVTTMRRSDQEDCSMLIEVGL